MPNFVWEAESWRAKFREGVAKVRLKGSADSVKAQVMPITLASVEGSTVTTGKSKT